MSISIRAKGMSELLKLWPKYTAEECEDRLGETLRKGEKWSFAPRFLKARYEDNENGRIVYVNENAESPYVVFYIHGGAYYHDIIFPHWKLIEKIAKTTGASVIVPLYRLVPFATYKEAYELILPLYKKYLNTHLFKKIILIGDSAGGGFSLALAQYCKAEEIRMPDELVLISPWVDVMMENEEIKEYQSKDPFLNPESLRIIAKHWADDLDPHNPLISPIYGDLKGIHRVTAFVGTHEILYPDIVKFYHMLDQDPANELIVAENMNHVYPLFPIPEAKPAIKKIIEVVMRSLPWTN